MFCVFFLFKKLKSQHGGAVCMEECQQGSWSGGISAATNRAWADVTSCIQAPRGRACVRQQISGRGASLHQDKLRLSIAFRNVIWRVFYSKDRLFFCCCFYWEGGHLCFFFFFSSFLSHQWRSGVNNAVCPGITGTKQHLC